MKCACGYSFLADPDNPQLYKNSRFDLNYKRVKKRIRNKEGSFIPGIISIFINRLINFKYKLQNFRLLPSAEQNKIITIIGLIVIILLIISLIYFFCPVPKKVPDEEDIALQLFNYAVCCSSSFLF